MSYIVFYEKPGCANNTRQKVLLASAGHTVWAKNLLTEPWTKERLLCFLGKRPVTEWFNRAAPKIKSGEIRPELLTPECALELLIAEPILIRRPLMEIEGRFETGFDPELIAGLIKKPEADLEQCRRNGLKPCP